jgi:hypothetical protein
VEIDGQPRVRGQDYTIDYDIGVINFSPALIVPPSSLIVVSFEYRPSGVAVGTLYALRLDYPVSPQVKVGASYLTVAGSGGGGGATSVARQDRWLGNNTAGPFLLSYRPIGAGSDVVKVEGILQVRDEDYQINYTTGEITFLRVIPLGAMIIVDYAQTQEVSGAAGDARVFGVDAHARLSRRVTLDAAYARSLVAGSTSGLAEPIQSRSLLVAVSGVSYPVAGGPIVEGSEAVTGDGTPWQRGVDYRMDYASGAITPLVAAARLRRGGTVLLVAYRQASEAADAAADGSGDAMVVRLAGNWKTLKVAATWRDIDAGFDPVAQVGAQRYERGQDVALEYRPGPRLRLIGSYSDYLHPFNQYSDTGEAGDLEVRDRQHSVLLDVTYPRWPQLRFTHTRRSSLDTQTVHQVTEKYATDALRLSWERAAFRATAEFGRTESRSRVPRDAYSSGGGDVEDLVDYIGATQTGRFTLGYNPSDRLNLTCTLADSRVSNSGSYAFDTHARGADFLFDYRATKRLTVSGSQQRSKTGASSSAGGEALPETDSNVRRLGLQFDVRPGLGVNVGFDWDRLSGGETSNSQTQGFNAGFWWQRSRRLSLNGTFLRQRVAYLGTTGASTNDISMLGVRLGPIRNVRLDLDLQHMVGANSGSFSGDGGTSDPVSSGNRLDSARLRVTRPLNAKQEAFVQAQFSRNQGYPSDSRRLSVGGGWSYAVSRLLKIALTMDHIDYTDLITPSNDYRADIISAQLDSNF